MAEGDGGLRQMYNYASANFQNEITQINTQEESRKTAMTLEQLQKQRDMEIR
jgi:hypothetical protein